MLHRLVAIRGLTAMGLAAVVGLVRAVDSPLRAAPDTTLVAPIIAPTPLTAAATPLARRGVRSCAVPTALTEPKSMLRSW